ncbi:MAG: hypothetical protein G8D89_16405 [gamma proteobacterium symbiont of Clathrolucina costata]
MHLEAIKDCRLEGSKLVLPDYQIPPKDYQKVKRAISGIGGVWNTQAQAFFFDSDPTELFERVCKGEVIDLNAAFKKRTQYFPTTESVLDEISAYLSIGNGYRVLEPQAGEGTICDFLCEQFPQDQIDWSLDVCELHQPFSHQLVLKGYNVIGSDFLELPKPERGYHLIVANPPFSSGQDVTHFWKMYAVLAPGGRIITVMSNRWRTGRDAKSVEFQHWLGYYFHSVVELPKGSFKQSGTNIESCLLIIDKPLDEAY